MIAHRGILAYGKFGHNCLTTVNSLQNYSTSMGIIDICCINYFNLMIGIGSMIQHYIWKHDITFHMRACLFISYDSIIIPFI